MYYILNDPPSSDNDNKRATYGKDASFSIPTHIDYHEHHRMSGTLRPNLPLASNQRELLGVASNFYTSYPSHATVVGIPPTATTNESSSVGEMVVVGGGENTALTYDNLSRNQEIGTVHLEYQPCKRQKQLDTPTAGWPRVAPWAMCDDDDSLGRHTCLTPVSPCPIAGSTRQE